MHYSYIYMFVRLLSLCCLSRTYHSTDPNTKRVPVRSVLQSKRHKSEYARTNTRKTWHFIVLSRRFSAYFKGNPIIIQDMVTITNSHQGICTNIENMDHSFIFHQEDEKIHVLQKLSSKEIMFILLIMQILLIYLLLKPLIFFWDPSQTVSFYTTYDV